MKTDKITLKKEFEKDKDFIMNKLINGDLSDKEKAIFTWWLMAINKYIDICKSRGNRY